MTEEIFTHYVNFLREKRVFPVFLLNNNDWQINIKMFISSFERFLKTEEGKEYLNNLESNLKEKIKIITGSIPSEYEMEKQCPECPKPEDFNNKRINLIEGIKKIRK